MGCEIKCCVDCVVCFFHLLMASDGQLFCPTFFAQN